jgi:hypothetical protein
MTDICTSPPIYTVLTKISGTHPHMEGYKHPSFEAFVLEYGQHLPKIAARPARMTLGKLGICYHNAFTRQEHDRYYYTEGYCYPQNVPMPVLHAWITDSTGAVIEVTYKEPALDYFGIVFQPEFVLDMAYLTRKAGIIVNAHKDNYRIFKTGLNPDEFIRLDALK